MDKKGVESDEVNIPKGFRYIRYPMLALQLVAFYVGSTVLFKILIYLNNRGAFDKLKKFVSKVFIEEVNPNVLVSPNVLLILLSGYILYVFKRKQQFYYGIVETLFALGSCRIVSDIIKVSLQKGNTPLYSIVIAGITTLYLLVRGLSNVREGYDKKFFLKKYLEFFLDMVFLKFDEFHKKYSHNRLQE